VLIVPTLVLMLVGFVLGVPYAFVKAPSVARPLLCQSIGAFALWLIGLWLINQHPNDFKENGSLLILVVLAGLAVVNPIWGIFVKPWWLYVALSTVGGFFLMSLSLSLLDLFRPGTGEQIGPAAMAFLLPAFPFVMLNSVAFVIRLVARNNAARKPA
jgi:hypothetical protein